VKEALVYKKLSGKKVRCQVCLRGCVIAPNASGFCQTKVNQNGKLYAVNYGLIQGIQVDPIEKKPFYHFRPGSLVPSIGSYGCNFRCKQCLNWWCSWGEPATSILKEAQKQQKQPTITPEQLITKIKHSDYQGIAFTYNEPVIWAEYVLDAARLAKKAGLFTVFVTNGSWTKETLDKIGEYIDAANVDFKGFSERTYARMGGFFSKIPEMTKYGQQKYNIFMEITTLLIPGINDNPAELKKMTTWMVKNLGPKTPWHLSRFDPEAAPDEGFKKIPPTSVAQLEKAAEIGKKAGLEFIYIWAPGEDMDGGVYSKGDTYCPKCNSLAVRRTGWSVEILGVDKDGNCIDCGEELNIKLT
jgi:pyruvate formate lyase activating enzyme